MRPPHPLLPCLVLAVGCQLLLANSEAAESPAVEAFFRTHCLRCHGPDKQEADFSVEGLSERVSGDNLDAFERALEMISIGDMPPEDQPQPSDAQRQALIASIRSQLTSLGRAATHYELQLPKFANRVDHEALFSGQHKGPAYTPSRVWRMNGHIYSQLAQDLDLGRDFVPPLNKLEGEGFDDYAILYADESTIRTMLQNARRVAKAMVHGRLVKPAGAGARDPDARSYRAESKHRPLAEFAAIQGEPSRPQMDEAVRYTFKCLLHRDPTAEEIDRYVSKNLALNVDAGGPADGVEALIVALLLSPEFLFRMELGLGEQLPDGRRMLSPHELAYALSYALHDHPVEWVLEEADAGRLRTRADVERVARALLDDPQLLRGREAVGHRDRPWRASKPYEIPAKPRLLRFFQEYFDYNKAVEVFKDETRHGGTHDAQKIVRDANWLVLTTLARDERVLETLLTTDRYPVDYYHGKRDKAKHLGYARVYNLSEPSWSSKQLVTMPSGQRAGMLTHPAWLVAHSGNFETDPVRRGKWIQEHLLGGVVPDLPIGVEAQLPEEPHHTLRERFRVVRRSACWRCHTKMNPLGEPLEAYDDFGMHRERHYVTPDGEVLASELEMHRKSGITADPKMPVDTSGVLEGTGDPQLDGDVADAVDLARRLAKSDRVRQVFLRHVFRFWMGRNEMLSDSPTLMAMDRAYVESNGSFNETLVALLTSDSFLTRN